MADREFLAALCELAGREDIDDLPGPDLLNEVTVLPLRAAAALTGRRSRWRPVTEPPADANAADDAFPAGAAGPNRSTHVGD